MHYITTFIDRNEPCHGVWEGYEHAPIPGAQNGATGWRWLRKTFVVREDTISKYIEDFGPAEEYEGRITPIFIPGNGEETVDALWFWAEKNRHDTYWQERAKEHLAESQTAWELIEQQDKLHRVIHNRTSSGPYVTVQRNGYSHEQTMRDLKERHRERTGRIQL